jgi:large subunit ribosomal protein L31
VKPGTHPTWYPDAVVTCACGNTFTTGSTKKEIHTDVCSNCHPFFTGEQRIVDTAGQVERFMKRAGAKDRIATARPEAQEKRGKKEKRRETKTAATPIAPAELPLAVMEEKPQEIAPELPKFEEPTQPAVKSEPVAQVKIEEAAPVVTEEEVRTVPTELEPIPELLPEPEAIAEVEVQKIERKVKTRAAKSAARKAPAKKPAAKAKKAAPKASLAKKPTKPKTAAKKKSKK